MDKTSWIYIRAVFYVNSSAIILYFGIGTEVLRTYVPTCY